MTKYKARKRYRGPDYVGGAIDRLFAELKANWSCEGTAKTIGVEVYQLFDPSIITNRPEDVPKFVEPFEERHALKFLGVI